MSIKKYLKIAKKDLFPLCRSLTGKDTLKTLKIIKKQFPALKIKKITSKTKVFDWKVPPSWDVSDAYILDKYEKKIINFKLNNLHLVGYSIPINKKVSKKELLKRLHSLKERPKSIPYITSYYKKYWGFCTTYENKKKIEKNYNNNDRFKIIIKSKFNSKGTLNYGEIVVPGKSKQEIFLSTYVCHPSMANNELSGPIVSMALINYFKKLKNNEKTLRFIFVPETIGAITYLHKNLDKLKKNVIAGYNLTCIGDDRMHSCIFSKYENSLSNKALKFAYKKLAIKPKVYDFLYRGSDERQYNSPGIDLPIATVCRTKFGEYPEYHTSDDNFSLVTKSGLQGGFEVVKNAILFLMSKKYPRSTVLCEPFLSKRNLYPSLSIRKENYFSKKLTDFLQYSDAKNNLDEIRIKIKINKRLMTNILKIFIKHKLIEI
jgi:aminopeptidase-like protein